jgi:alkylhydroperoxidase family enzyme
MQQQLDAVKVSPAAFKAMAGLHAYVDQSGLDRSLLELVKVRASQIKAAPIAS